MVVPLSRDWAEYAALRHRPVGDARDPLRPALLSTRLAPVPRMVGLDSHGAPYGAPSWPLTRVGSFGAASLRRCLSYKRRRAARPGERLDFWYGCPRRTSVAATPLSRLRRDDEPTGCCVTVEEAEVDAAGIQRLESAMTTPKDRHVLAARRHSGTDRPSTSTTFRPEACEPFVVEATPDPVRARLPRLNPEGVKAALEQQAPAKPERALAGNSRSPSWGRAPARLGLGSGDRFESFQGSSGPFKGRVQRREKGGKLQGKRANKGSFPLA